jgi:hypothetical protein
MVSYRQLASGQVVLHERETSSSGRPKARMLQRCDEFFCYEYDSRGGLISKREKSALQRYADFFKYVEFKDGKRLTPLTEFEKQIGVKTSIETYRYRWCIRPRYGCQERTFTKDEWKIFRQTHTIDYGNVKTIHTPDKPVHIGQGTYDWNTYFTDKANELNLEIVGGSNLINNLEFREKQKPAVVEKTRPNPKEVEKVEPVEIEPIKEAVKYSPLMIAGVIAVVVILLLKRRRA